MPCDATKSVSAMASPNHASVSVEDWKGKISTGFGLAHAAAPSAAHRAHPTSSPQHRSVRSLDPASGVSRHRGYPLFLHHASRARAGPTRRIAISGTSATVTSPTSQGHRSVGIRDAPPVGRKASLASLSGPPPVSSRQLSQESLVRAEVAELLRVRYHQSRELRADQLCCSRRVVMPDQVHALLPRAGSVPRYRPGATCSSSTTVSLLVRGRPRRPDESRKLMNSPLGSIASTVTTRLAVPPVRRWPWCRCACPLRSVHRVDLGPELVERRPIGARAHPTWPWRPTVNATDRPSP